MTLNTRREVATTINEFAQERGGLKMPPPGCGGRTADPQVSGTRRFTSRAAFTMQAGRGHRERIAKVKEVYDEMMRIAEAIHDRGGGR
jgi:hypothetical protein